MSQGRLEGANYLHESHGAGVLPVPAGRSECFAGNRAGRPPALRSIRKRPRTASSQGRCSYPGLDDPGRSDRNCIRKQDNPEYRSAGTAKLYGREPGEKDVIPPDSLPSKTSNNPGLKYDAWHTPIAQGTPGGMVNARMASSILVTRVVSRRVGYAGVYAGTILCSPGNGRGTPRLRWIGRSEGGDRMQDTKTPFLDDFPGILMNHSRKKFRKNFWVLKSLDFPGNFTAQ